MKTLRHVGIFLCILFISFALSAQDSGASSSNAGGSDLPPQIQAFVDAFDQVDETAKLEVIQTTIDVPVADLELFYTKVLDYVVSHSDEILTNTNVREMAMLSFPRIVEGGFSGFGEPLWVLFNAIDETFWRIEVLQTMAQIGGDEQQLVINMTDWLDRQNLSKQAGARPDIQVILETVRTLVAFADPIVYPTLVETIMVQYSAEISAAALQGILAYDDRAQMLVSLVFDNQPTEKAELYDMYLSRSEFDDIIQEISFGVLNDVLDQRPNNVEERIILDNIRLKAVAVLTEEPREEYATALIRHFNAAIQAYDRGTAAKSLVLEAIGALGQTDSVDAAVRLSEFLDLINTYTELDRPYDRQITLAVINNLRNLGKVEAYQSLYMVTILNYSNGVQAVAREALAALSQ